MSDDRRGILLQKIAEKAVEEQEIMSEGKFLRYVWLVLLVTTPIAYSWGWGLALATASFWVFFIVVGYYLNYFHLRGKRFEKEHLLADLRKLEAG